MAEQDRYASHLGANPTNPVKDSPSVNLHNLPKGSGAEQDRYGGWFGGKAPSADQVRDRIQDNLPHGSGAEQDRFGGWFGRKAPTADQIKDTAGDVKDRIQDTAGDVKDRIQDNFAKTSGAEQDRYGGWFGGKAPSASEVNDRIKDNLPHTSGAEQDRYGGWLGGKAPSADDIKRNFPQGSGGAEQDRFGGWFGRKAPTADQIQDRAGDVKNRIQDTAGDAKDRIQDSFAKSSGAEQDRYGGWFGGKGPSARDISEKLPHTSGAEQDQYGRWFGDKAPSMERIGEKINERLPHTSGAEQDRYASHFSIRPSNPVEATPGSSSWSTRNISSGAEQDRFGSHFSTRPSNPINATAVGLLQSTILPSFGLHTGLSAVAYGVSRYTDTAEGKDILWPTGIVANAWWSAVGTRVIYDGLSVSDAWSTITYPEKILLTQVSAWGIRLLYRVTSRLAKRGKDDPRYTAAKKDPQFWNKAAYKMFLPEAVVQTLISLPLTLPFRAGVESARASPLPENASLFHSLAIFLFTTGYALEVLGDAQLEKHKKYSHELNREGVWSIVRHPK